MREAVPCIGWRVGSDSIPSRPRLRANNRTLSRLQAEDSRSCQRPHRHRTVACGARFHWSGSPTIRPSGFCGRRISHVIGATATLSTRQLRGNSQWGVLELPFKCRRGTPVAFRFAPSSRCKMVLAWKFARLAHQHQTRRECMRQRRPQHKSARFNGHD